MKKLFVFVMVILLVGTFSVFAATITIGVLGKAAEAYWMQVNQGAQAAAKALGITVNFYAPQTEDIPGQISAFQGYVAQGMAGIAIAPSAPDAVVPYIKKAISMGIPVVTIDTDAASGSGRYFYIGTDNYKAGYIGGQEMVKLLNGKGNVVIITGSLSANNSLERIQGFEDALKGTDIKVLTILNDQEDAAKAFSLAQSAISTYGNNLNAFYGVYYEDGPAEANALKSAGFQPGQIKVVCFDMGPDTLKYTQEGYIQAATVQKPYFMGYFAVMLLYDMAKIGPLGPQYVKMMENNTDVIDTGITVVTPNNLNDYIQWTKQLGIPSSY
jgi:ribose transport system substrate-binding protein